MTTTIDSRARKRRAPAPRKRCADPAQMDFDALLGALDPGLDLIEVPAAPATVPGGLDFDLRMRRLLKQALDACPLGHDQVAEAVSALTGRTVTVAMIYSWTGQSRPHRFPAEMIPAFCQALGNSILVQGLADACGCRVAESQELQLARLGQLWLIIHHAKGEQTRMAQAIPTGGRRHG